MGLLSIFKKKEEAKKIDPVQQYIWAGDAEFVKQEWDAALEFYKKALNVTYKNDEVHLKIGLVLAKKGFYGEAYQCFESAINLNQDNNEAYYGLGFVLYKMRQFDRAIRNFQIAAQKGNNRATQWLTANGYKVK